MSDRIPSDHDAVETHRGTLERVGRTDRPKILVPEAVADTIPTDDVVRLAIDGSSHHAHVEAGLDGQLGITGAYDSPALARSPGDGENRLAAWVDAAPVSVGESVLFDVVTAGFKYGVRAPGERVVYEATDPPSDSLSAIAHDLEE